MSDVNNPAKRKEVREKISKTLTGKRHSKETRNKQSMSGKDKIFSEIHRKNLTISQTGPKNHRYGKFGELSATYGKIKITNGIQNRLIDSHNAIPDGWFRGQTNKKKL